MTAKATRKAALIVATLTSFMTPFMGSSINLALPSMARELEMDAVLLSWVPTAYLLASAVSLVPFGRVADIHGRKRVFTWGILAFTFFSLLCAMANSAAMLIFLRVLQGIGSAMIFATGIAILTSVFPPQERGRVLGINVAAVYVGLSAGPFLGGLLTEHFTWRSVFLANVPMGLVTLFLVVRRLKAEWAEARGESFDLVGSLIYAGAITAMVCGISLLPDLRSLWITLGGILALILFVRWEGKAPSPVLNLDLFRANRVFAFSSLAALIHYSATFAVTFLLSLYLQHIKALSAQEAGLILVSQPVIMALFSPLAGRLSDRIEPRIVASTGMALTTVGLFLFISLGESSTVAFVVFRLMLLGLGLALFSSPNTNAIM
ncbi:MAG: MFS transporter, partial [Deltaproteobacteria bacterium]|nr:MFS transporter [Deltaproteobacteria bacterium]